MTRRITIDVTTQLQFGAFVQTAVKVFHDGVLITQNVYNYNANKISACVDTINPNVAVIHFDNINVNISNGQYNEYYFGATPQASPLALAQTVITDAAQYTV